MLTQLARRGANWLNASKPPKGFEKFYPKNGKSYPKTPGGAAKHSGAKEAGEKMPKDGFSFSSKARKLNPKNSGGGNNSKKPPSDYERLGPVIGLAAGGIFLSVMYGPGSAGAGREINFTDFRNTLMASGEVERVVVTNKNVARVVMKQGSEAATRMKLKGASSSVAGMKRSTAGVPDAFGDSTTLDMTNTSTPNEKNAFSSAQGANEVAAFANVQPTFYFTIGSVENFERKLEIAQREMGVSPENFIPVQYTSETSWYSEIVKLAPTILIIGVTMMLLRSAGGAGGGGGGMGNVFKIGKSKAKKIKKEEISVTFKDVAGCKEAKVEIMEFVDFLSDGSRFTKLGAKIPKGALLCGPPGTGKTLLAKAVAGEANVPFYSISGSDFIEMFVGVGPARVRDLFKEARENAPCIVFIDEIDAVGKKRGQGGMGGGNDERENTLNQLLVEMDGFAESSGVVVLAATNRVDTLDAALTRPGRFDRQVQVDKPDIEGRKEIFEVHLKEIKVDGDIADFAGRLAGLTPGLTGADIANMCNEGAIQAARRKADSVTLEDFEKASDRVVGGLESNKLISKKEKEIVAHHEAGHAVAGWFLEHADPLMKVTIVPRSSGALGFAQYLPKEVFLRTREQITDIICMALAGRAAEQIMFGRVTTGASDDLRRVTGMVYQMIQVYGMNEKIGQLSFPKDESNPYAQQPYSDEVASAMDAEAKLMVDEAYKRTMDLLLERKEELVKVADLLMEKETITHDDVVDLIGHRPFEADEQYTQYISTRKKIDEVKEKSAAAAAAAVEEGEEEEVAVPPLGFV